MKQSLPQYKIYSNKEISNEFIKIGIDSLQDAATYIGSLPYGRNTDRSNYKLVLKEERGTCSTKHALLAELCREQQIDEIKLVIGIYKMNETNTKGVGKVLDQYGLPYLPEAHCYLKINEGRFDFTRLDVESEEIDEFFFEEEILPSQIGAYKEELHRGFLIQWLGEINFPYSLDEVWSIREECIKALG